MWWACQSMNQAYQYVQFFHTLQSCTSFCFAPLCASFYFVFLRNASCKKDLRVRKRLLFKNVTLCDALRRGPLSSFPTLPHPKAFQTIHNVEIKWSSQIAQENRDLLQAVSSPDLEAFIGVSDYPALVCCNDAFSLDTARWWMTRLKPPHDSLQFPDLISSCLNSDIFLFCLEVQS